MNWEGINKIYFLGIGGIGMSALARYFMSKGIPVSGYDRTPSPLTVTLIKEGANINYTDEETAIDDTIISNENTLFIYTPAIPKDNKILNLLIRKDKKLYKRSEILGLLSKEFKTIGIAGTHGKTTVSSITAHIMNTSKLGCQAFLGGIAKNYNSNLISHPSSKWMVVEADEYDRSFLKLYPQIGLITSMDADHLDIYGTHENLIDTFKEYTSQITHGGHCIINHKLQHYFNNSGEYLTYSLDNSQADFFASEIKLINAKYHFTLNHPHGAIPNIELQMPGIINLENTIAACAASLSAGVSDDEIKTAVVSFKGIKRRMELIVANNKVIYYDDYAHHPDEINASIKSLSAIYANKKLTVIFQPHLFSRTQDFTKEFAQSLDLADNIILLDIYPARETAIPGVTSDSILKLMKNKNSRIIKKEALITFLNTAKPELLLTLGAGDIDRLVEPIKNSFQW